MMCNKFIAHFYKHIKKISPQIDISFAAHCQWIRDIQKESQKAFFSIFLEIVILGADFFIPEKKRIEDDRVK